MTEQQGSSKVERRAHNASGEGSSPSPATKSLYEIEAEALRVEQLLMASGGELTPEIEAFLEQVERDLAVKVDAYDVVLDRMEATVNRLSHHAESYRRAASQVEGVRKKLTSRIKDVMKNLGKNKLEGDCVVFQIGKAKPALVITDESLIELRHRIIPSPVPDKEKIRSLLEAGLEVLGAELHPSFALRRTVKK